MLRPEDACRKRFSWFLGLNQKLQKCVNLVDLVKSLQTSIYDLLAKFGVDTAENGPLKVCQKFLNLRESVPQKLEKKFKKHRSQVSSIEDAAQSGVEIANAHHVITSAISNGSLPTEDAERVRCFACFFPLMKMDRKGVC